MSLESVPNDCYTNTDHEIGKRLFNLMVAMKMVQSSPHGRSDDTLAKADRLIESKALSFENALVAIKVFDLNLPRQVPIGDESAEDFVYKVLGFARISNNTEAFTLIISEFGLPVLDRVDDPKVQTTIDGQFPIEDTPECHVNPTPTPWPL
ncbi:hypothetical protein N8T08_005902 [Aspergillus melleus]|uniref:Uncharacterized protein n=1 Tax=Aspergillus melleus TaxID=138277 RepID=A0ACC3B1K7_9EURO|nr:hypothetical protein N8T08_005902 [Aspergillus melleus]